ncbi:germination protein, Ger(X)C family [Desulfosporosinus acidiphilus SJ4]|uniref:Germination protein, Ger(X)C family n=1 Tax=Desulfosporosinus acidiphilus (strain DSM 22704 / JCM 16185 / SJ4) TaxID=646529 RepID=I4D019_DESAJ|nr:Ger(x)C family spore germination protein [Desulfosporosinus acidiphilus]AFM39143.1 germination protein, Ger(X)C family [Desulfosporosinus acidiphilus SJ4]
MNDTKVKKRFVAVMLLVCLIFLPGCWGKREVEELAPLIGLGFDLGKKPGTFLITMQLAKPNQGGQGSAAKIEDRTFSVEVASAREATEMVYKLSSRIPFMGSLKVIVIGDSAAKAGFNDIIDFGQRFAEFRRTMYLVLTKGKAQTLLNMKLRDGELAAMSIKNHMEQGSSLSTFPTVRLGHYLTILGTQSTAPIIPVVESIKSGEDGIEYNDAKDGKELLIQGAGVLRGDKLVDYLTDKETKGYMWLENNVNNRLVNTMDSEGTISFGGQVLKSNTRYKLTNNNGVIGLQYIITTSISVDEVMGLKRQLSEAEWVDLMNQAEDRYAKVIQKECDLAIEKERELGLDFLGIGRHLEERDPSYWKTLKDQWEDKIADFPISLNVNVSVHHSGMSSSSSTVKLTEEGKQ